jgi:hypothetical protein
MNSKIEFYAEYDEESGLYHVFDTETGKSYYSSFTMELAELRAEEMNHE